MTQETKYTAFRIDEYGYSFYPSEWATTLDAFMEEVTSFYADWEGGVEFVAWAAEPTLSKGGTKGCDELARESIAAGRIIEKVDGKYVARGIPEEKTVFSAFTNEHTKPKSCPGCGAHEGDLHGVVCPEIAVTAEPKREPLTWAKPTKFDNFKGYEVYSGFVDYIEPLQGHPLQSSPDLAVDRIPFGSAHLLEG